MQNTQVLKEYKINTEKASSAITLSDMEIFVFPELIYSLVLANIMSSHIWKWLDNLWFKNINKMSKYKKILRIKQYIIDNYAFNLDLETWGLTTQEKELNRFKDFINLNDLKQSNALFGYHGDKYYFDLDIRKHFGLDKYKTNVIPYWKTETVEAMDAFKYKPEYKTGAGECVSLAALYAAALFVVGKIPLDDIYLLATPLHSQNFICVNEGILTNNRRVITKNMWNNGSQLSTKARRALENEQVTIVAHHTGIIHTLYKEANIDPNSYKKFGDDIRAYLRTPLTSEIFGNCLRANSQMRQYFQIAWHHHGSTLYIPYARAFLYEHNSKYSLTDKNYTKIMEEIDRAEFYHNPIKDKIVFNEIKEILDKSPFNLCCKDDISMLKEIIKSFTTEYEYIVNELKNFCCIKPKLPDEEEKEFTNIESPINITTEMSRDDIIDHLDKIKEKNNIAYYSFYSFRDISKTNFNIFLKTAIERNPVSVEKTKSFSTGELIDLINSFENDSIYDEPSRLAQPDEVYNYRRGDGLEKALLIISILKTRDNNNEIILNACGNCIKILTNNQEYLFKSNKDCLNVEIKI